MRYLEAESTYILANFTAGDTVTIDVYRLSDNTQIISAAPCSEIASTGRFKYSFSQTVSVKTEYLYVISNGSEEQQGKIILGGWPDSIKNKTDNLPASPAPADEYDSALAAIQADLDNPDQYKADVSGLAPAGEYDMEMARIDVSVSSRSSHSAADVWTAATRTLTSFGTLISDIWAATVRTLTAGTKDAEIDAVLADTNELQTNQGNWLTASGFATQNPPSQNLDDYKADVSALALETTAQDIKAKTDTILWSDVQEILKLTGNKVTKSNDVITIYESDGVTVWKQYDLADGGRVEV